MRLVIFFYLEFSRSVFSIRSLTHPRLAMRWYIFSARALNIDQITLKETYNIGLITSNHARLKTRALYQK